MTIELTLLMPLIIAVFLFIFFTAYYLHDIVAINKGISTALGRGSLSEDERMSEMKKGISDIRLLGKWDMDTNYEEGKDTVIIKFSGNMAAKEGLFRKIIKDKYEYITEKSAPIIDEVKYVRSRRRSY